MNAWDNPAQTFFFTGAHLNKLHAISVLLLSSFLLPGVQAQESAAALPPSFSKALQLAGIPAQNAGVYVQEVDGAGKVLASANAGTPFNPASTMKLVTTDAALYDWVEVAAWLQHRGAVTEQVYQNAVIVREVNTDLDHQHRERQLAAEKAQDRRQMG